MILHLVKLHFNVVVDANVRYMYVFPITQVIGKQIAWTDEYTVAISTAMQYTPIEEVGQRVQDTMCMCVRFSLSTPFLCWDPEIILILCSVVLVLTV